jgi:hypothetical protein
MTRIERQRWGPARSAWTARISPQGPLTNLSQALKAFWEQSRQTNQPRGQSATLPSVASHEPEPAPRTATSRVEEELDHELRVLTRREVCRLQRGSSCCSEHA